MFRRYNNLFFLITTTINKNKNCNFTTNFKNKNQSKQKKLSSSVEDTTAITERVGILLPPPLTTENNSNNNNTINLKLDDLGPVVVNEDGTISQITNW